MAWITKNSAATTIERREEPYLDAAMRSQLEFQVLVRYPTRQAATLSVLHFIQEKHGWLPYQALEEAADFLELSPAQVLDTASFYEEYWMRPKGRYVIWICQSLSCELMGHLPLLEHLRAKLGVDVGQTTEDGRITLMTVECLGSCDTGPVALVNETLHEKLTLANVDEILDGLS
jgi:NADH-quinone oxidoreductase subunit E